MAEYTLSTTGRASEDELTPVSDASPLPVVLTTAEESAEPSPLETLLAEHNRLLCKLIAGLEFVHGVEFPDPE